MSSKNSESQICIKKAEKEDLFDVRLCASDFIELLDNFQKKFLNKEYFVLLAYYKNVLSGILVAQENTQNITSFENLLPNTTILLLYVNPQFRNNGLGKRLLTAFIDIQKKKDIAIVYTHLPKQYKQGINFYKNYGFRQIGIQDNQVALEIVLWKDYGVLDCRLVEDSINDVYI